MTAPAGPAAGALPPMGPGLMPTGDRPSVQHAPVSSARRDVFWQNVLREVLMGLAAAATSGGRISPTPAGAATSAEPVGALFDGRTAVITHTGQRIPIADIYPVFACSIPGDTHARVMSADVQCTVFRIKTPGGEMFTLPIGMIAMVHTLSAELLGQLEAAAEARANEAAGDDQKMPFGFAAFTSMSRAESEGPVAKGQDSNA